jgi:hypothetical protein
LELQHPMVIAGKKDGICILSSPTCSTVNRMNIFNALPGIDGAMDIFTIRHLYPIMFHQIDFYHLGAVVCASHSNETILFRNYILCATHVWETQIEMWIEINASSQLRHFKPIRINKDDTCIRVFFKVSFTITLAIKVH